MEDRLSRRLVLAVVSAAITAGSAAAQAPPLAMPGENISTPLVLPPDGGDPAVPVTPPAPYATRPGWFVEFEAGGVGPRINHLATSRDGIESVVSQLHSIDLDWGGAGEVGFGYRFACGGGVRASWRAFGSSAQTTQGGLDAFALEPAVLSGVVSAPLPDGVLATSYSTSPAVRELHTELEVHRFDLDYISPDWQLFDSFRLDWSAGFRTTLLHVVTQATDSFTLTQTQTVRTWQYINNPWAMGYDPSFSYASSSLPLTLQQRATDTTAGFGIHAGLGGTWDLGPSGLALFGRGDAGILGAVSRQEFRVSAKGPTPVPDATADLHGPGWMATGTVRAGIQYTLPMQSVWVRVSAGYVFDALWFRATGSGARARALFTDIDVIDQGPFGRCEISF
jgi:hypothetical protein